MADYKARRARKRASGGKVGEGNASPTHGHMIIMIGLAKKPKKKAGGKVDGAAARKHLGKRARGGPPKRADGGATDDNMSDAYKSFGTVMDRAHNGPVKDHDAGMQSADIALDRMHKIAKEPTKYPDNQPEGYPAPVNPQRARGGRAPSDGPRVLDARDDAQETGQDGRDKVSQRSGTEERAVEMEDARKRGGHVTFRTPSGGVSAGARREAEGKGDAMPGGRFPIRNASDLSNAKHAFGRANDKPAVKRWIDKRAHDLGKPPLGGE